MGGLTLRAGESVVTNTPRQWAIEPTVTPNFAPPALTFDIPGDPEAQGSSRAFVVKGRAVVTSTNGRLKSWRREAVAAAQDAMRPVASDYPLTGAVEVVATFWFTRPRTHYGTGRNAGVLKATAPKLPSTKLDADRLARALCDALTIAGVWRDDRQVSDLHVRKRYADRPGVSVAVCEADDAAEMSPPNVQNYIAPG